MILAAESPLDPRFSPQAALLALGGLGAYVASRAAADALSGGDPDRPGRRAIGHCLPIAITALLCLHPAFSRPGLDADNAGRPPIAVAVLLASAVACLTLIFGIVTYLAPLKDLPPSRKAWPFVLPAALIALVAGIGGTLTWVHALMLALLGLVVLNLWLGAPAIEAQETATASPQNHDAPAPRLRPTAWFQLALSVGLALVGGWAMVRGAARLEQSTRMFSGVLLGAGVLAPLLTLPVLGSMSRIAERGRSDSAATTLVAIALINLCAVLPLVIVVNQVKGLIDFPPQVAATTATTTAPTTAAMIDQRFSTPPEPSARAVPYPMVSWRIDTVLLIVVGFAMVPWSSGRWTIGRAESIAMIVLYAIYLGLIAVLSTMWQ